jgi:hypothetical protein
MRIFQGRAWRVLGNRSRYFTQLIAREVARLAPGTAPDPTEAAFSGQEGQGKARSSLKLDGKRAISVSADAECLASCLDWSNANLA